MLFQVRIVGFRSIVTWLRLLELLPDCPRLARNVIMIETWTLIANARIVARIANPSGFMVRDVFCSRWLMRLL